MLPRQTVEPAVESRIVEATGTAGGGSMGLKAKDIEAAMNKAIEDATAEGITDPEKIRERMLEARRRVKEEFRAAQEASRDRPE
jgi:hypothetical protein